METIFDQLKSKAQIEHTRHRNAINCVVNLFADLIAYSDLPPKNWSREAVSEVGLRA